jgi:tetratricopeptide (TPR) repeat protein
MRCLEAVTAKRFNLALATCCLALGIFASVPLPSTAYGGLDNYQLPESEVAILPEFCRQTQLINRRYGSDEGYREWIQRVGFSFTHMHHYCIAVIGYTRSFRHNNTAADRSGYLTFAWQNLDYVVRNADPGFVFMPEVYFKRGQVSFRQGDSSAALQDLEHALRLNPKHVRAALELSRVFISLDNSAQAEKVLVSALEGVPDSKSLTAALQELRDRKSMKKPK